MHFTSFSQTHILLKIQFYRQAPGNFCRFTTTPLVHTEDPGKTSDLAIGSSGASGLKSGEGSPEFGRGSAEEGPRDHFGSVCALNWGRETGSELARRSRTVAAAASYGPGEDEEERGNTR
jgi:hypothetical protein